MSEAASEDALLRRAAAGECGAFEALVDRTAPAVWSLLRRLTADEATAEDAMQETFVAAWRSAPQWRGDGAARSWLLGLARRHAARTWRRRAGEPSQHESLAELALSAGWGSDPEVAAARSEDRALLLGAMARLSEGDREVLGRCDLEGLTPTELAAELGEAPGTVRVRRHRARLRLLAVLRSEVCDA